MKFQIEVKERHLKQFKKWMENRDFEFDGKPSNAQILKEFFYSEGGMREGDFDIREDVKIREVKKRKYMRVNRRALERVAQGR